MVRKGASTISQIQVQWSDSPRSMLIWEEIEDLHRRFPTSPARGQVGFRGGGNVRTSRKARRVKAKTVNSG